MMFSEPPVKTFMSERKFLGMAVWFRGDYFYLFTFFASQSLHTRVSLRDGGGAVVSNQVLARILVSTELKVKLKYSQRLPLTQLCLGSPGKKEIDCEHSNGMDI